MSTDLVNVPEPLFRYPSVSCGELCALRGWVASLRSRALVALLADPTLEAKLVAVRRDELREHRRLSVPHHRLVRLALVAAGVGCGALTFLFAAGWRQLASGDQNGSPAHNWIIARPY